MVLYGYIPILSESLLLLGSGMFGATFNLVTLVGLPYFLEHKKTGSLEIDSLALNNCFSYRNVFQNGVDTVTKMVFKSRFFVKKLKNFV